MVTTLPAPQTSLISLVPNLPSVAHPDPSNVLKVDPETSVVSLVRIQATRRYGLQSRRGKACHAVERRVNASTWEQRQERVTGTPQNTSPTSLLLPISTRRKPRIAAENFKLI